MTEDEVEDETVDEAVVQIGGGERHFLEDTIHGKKNIINWGYTIQSEIGLKKIFKERLSLPIANCKRYSVTMAPLKEGSFQSRMARLGPRHWTRGALGVSGAPAPLTTSKLSDQGPAPTRLKART